MCQAYGSEKGLVDFLERGAKKAGYQTASEYLGFIGREDVTSRAYLRRVLGLPSQLERTRKKTSKRRR